jgi:hypothetical protein
MDSSLTVPRWRKITFYVIAVLVLAMILGLLLPLLTFVVLAWLPVDTWQAVFPGEDVNAGAVVHRIHELSQSLVFWGATIGVGLQLWKPEKRQAPMLQALAVLAAFYVIEGVSGSFDVEAIPIMVGVALLVLLHPAREGLYRFNRPDAGMAGLAILTAIPGAFFILDHINKQRLNLPGDEHAELMHWSTMAVFATLILLWGLIGSTDRTGWRITAWLAGISAAAYGLASLVFPTVSSASGTGWAIAAIGWGAGYIVLTERRAQSPSGQSVDAPARAVSSGGGSP